MHTGRVNDNITAACYLLPNEAGTLESYWRQRERESACLFACTRGSRHASEVPAASGSRSRGKGNEGEREEGSGSDGTEHSIAADSAVGTQMHAAD